MPPLGGLGRPAPAPVRGPGGMPAAVVTRPGVRSGGRRLELLAVSAGYATWSGEPLERLVATADRGLYAAKEAGRDCVRPGDSAAKAPSR